MPSLFDILAPVLALIALGYVLARLGAITPAGEAGLSNLVFFATTPALLFRAMAAADLPGLREAGVLLAYFGPCLALYALWVAAATRRRGRSWAEAGIGAMGACFGNTVLLGIPIVERAHGPEGLRILVLIVSIHSATLFTLTTLLAELDRGGPRSLDVLGATARSMGRNPMVLSIVGGGLCGAAGIAMPAPIDGVLVLLGAATTPVALVAVGAGLAGFRLGAGVAPALVITLVKLVLFPALVWSVATVVIGLEPLAVAVATLAAALPVGTNVYVIARRYAAHETVAAGAILLSTLAAAVSVPIVIGALR